MKRLIPLLVLLLIAAIAVDIYFKEIMAYLWPTPQVPSQQLPTDPQQKPQQDPQAQQPTTPEPAQPTNPPADTPPAEAPKPTPTPTPEPQPPTTPRKPMERPHSAEHATALQTARAVEAAAPQAELEALVEGGSITPEAAQAIRDWAKEHPISKVEEIGTVITGSDGTKETRYRLVSEDGQQDMLISVITPRQGKPSVHTVQTTDADKTKLTPQSDALSVVEGFVEAVKRGDMSTARRLTSGKEVSDATLAGLCMIFEEGDFAMRKNLPIRNMFRNGDNEGYLIYLTAQQDGASRQPRNVGIELSHDPERGWTVKAVAMDDLLNRYETTAEAEGGVYFPLVKNPQGGDSIVLYFGFNDATLSPRSLSQLKIVASLLQASQGTLTISGHTDDIGSAAYNQQLSERRAEAVKQALITYGVGEQQISTRGLGKRQPLRTYHAGDNVQTIRTIRSSNRRAEIYLDF